MLEKLFKNFRQVNSKHQTQAFRNYNNISSQHERALTIKNFMTHTSKSHPHAVLFQSNDELRQRETTSKANVQYTN